MRRCLSGILLLVFLAQSSSIAVATAASDSRNGAPVRRIDSDATKMIVASVPFSRNAPHPLIRHTPLPLRPMANYGSRQRYAELVLKPQKPVRREHVARPVDLTKSGRSKAHAVAGLIERPAGKHRLISSFGSGRSGGRPLGNTLTSSTTGIWPWWAFQSRSIPGLGLAMVNLSTLNFLFLETDIDVQGSGVDLAFNRVYNSQSNHDATNDDGSTPSVYGNRWTNNLDAHLAWIQGSGNTGTVSVYTADGARDDYTCEIDIQQTCSSPTGIYDLLATTDLQGGIACQFQWTNKYGVSYIFNAPYSGCGHGPGSYGRLIRIYGRNQNFYLDLAYSWNPDDSNPENLAQITVTHQPDGGQMLLSFGYLANNPNVTELATITRPDGQILQYYYNSNGELLDIDKPGNNAILPGGESAPRNFLDGNSIAAGNLPETYDVVQPGQLLEVCGPRAAISIIKTNNNPNDGACVDFDYSNHKLSDWYTKGVLNPTPSDGVISTPLQSGPTTGWGTWGDTTYFDNPVCSPNEGTEMQDGYGHAAVWCMDTSGRLVETEAEISSSNWLITYQSWDSNNDLASITDARRDTTNIAYDSGGNVVEVSLPSQTTSVGTVRPTYFYDHDAYNNLTNYCDPANESASENNWNPNPGPTPCSGSGAASYAKFRYNYLDGNELYGCQTAAYTPSNYSEQITYSGGSGVCGTGEPSTVEATSSFSQADHSTRQPTQQFTYGTAGNLKTYSPGEPSGAAWTITYTSDGMKRIRSITDPDNVTSYQCDNPDGSTAYSETAVQYADDNNANCQTMAPLYATAYNYDADGNIVMVASHHDCPDANGLCAANNAASAKCYAAQVTKGTACYFTMDSIGSWR